MKDNFRQLLDDLGVELDKQSKAMEDIKTTLDDRDQEQQARHEALKILFHSLQVLPGQVQQLAEEATKATKSERILGHLRFPDMFFRDHAIDESFSDTFSWIFEDNFKTFQDWLRSGEESERQFWISGKAGSGKSTLMKFLARHHGTRAILSQWAGDGNLTIADHYFWFAGTPLQKSMRGLLRTLLYIVLRQCPELIPLVFPQEWNSSIEQSDTFFDHDQSWTAKYLSEAMASIGAKGLLTSKFCFFIDGLDEYEGDHYELINTLERWSRSPHIKLCVSSRPWNVFERSYGSSRNRMLRLHELTRKDMVTYVQGSLADDWRFRQLAALDSAASDIPSTIANRAEGVFLWVSLVVRSLLRGMNEGDDMPGLKARLNAMPSDLEGFFLHIFEKIDRNYRNTTIRAFQLASIAVPMPAVAFTYIDRDLENEQYAIEAPISPLDQNQADKMRHTARFRINAWCRDLLEVRVGMHKDTNIANDQVNFLHRTVKDFLSSDEMQNGIFKESICQSSPRQALCRIHLAELKVLPNMMPSTQTLAVYLVLEYHVELILKWAKQCEVHDKDTPFDTLQELARTRRVLRAQMKTWDTWSQHPRNLLCLAVRFECQLYISRALEEDPSANVGLLEHTLLRPSTKQRSTEFTIRSAFTMATFLLGLGANPNERATPNDSLNTTVWQQFLHEYYHEPDEERYLWRKAKTMIRYGADRDTDVEVEFGYGAREGLRESVTLSVVDCLLSHASEAEVASLMKEFSGVGSTQAADTVPEPGLIRTSSTLVAQRHKPEFNESNMARAVDIGLARDPSMAAMSDHKPSTESKKDTSHAQTMMMLLWTVATVLCTVLAMEFLRR